ncbi:putative proton-dependent oligopeptide transporter family, MFS transporter superfamily [Helianthus annuus]|nr:putative proton-dependent oligopeptide transporter family, MFS transporter superfamily [Helianthus annuus]
MIIGLFFSANQALATFAFFGVGVNLVLFLTRVMEQGNADAANTVSKWTGTVYLCSLLGAFLSDSYWGRYLTCMIFQIILVMVITCIVLLYTTLYNLLFLLKSVTRNWIQVIFVVQKNIYVMGLYYHY